MMEEQETAATSTYIFDTESAPELARLINQERMTTQAMGGPLSGIPDPDALKHIVDLGCGAGGWVLDVAFDLPEAEVEGFDVSRSMVNYAHARAVSQHRYHASFGLIDITQPFDLPDADYDLVNARFLTAVLQREAWLPFFKECRRVLRPGGYLRLTEAAEFGQTTSDVVNALLELSRRALYQLGYGFGNEHGLKIVPTLLSFFKEHHYQDIQVQASALHYSTGSEAWADQFHNLDVISHQMKPILLKLGLIDGQTYDTLHQEALIAMQLPAFCGVVHLSTVIGQKPGEEVHHSYAGPA